MLKDSISRNKPIFFLGLITFIIFMVIIGISEFRRIRNEEYGPKLVEAEENLEITIVPDTKTNSISDFVLEGSDPEYQVFPEENYADIDAKYKTVKIEYTKNGFSPKNAKVVLNQKVKWVNMTNENVLIKQDNAFYREFEKAMPLLANGALEFRMYRSGVWKLISEPYNHSGSITIIKP